ncbi:uncharacterized protein LOC115006582 [Cottoperca gobio]|uniref:Uncharacterized protein LOC115006559 n=1 Tax=Cottoperca gobio TaxID=56716 RepID=A0A6J2PH76_COTGO|nr:uncharacterized protein LOC115006559 [Cottoperca gobio]XP_029284695.1 uncharacterized protein LOC115006559 [Cottoperca gobio]XP_029284704.1 uncharacterized protein LOC115006559 [Cottoperca gobio]XP_029284712.1 uncharacterized protein LOC115006559 [Cottoperca gobio]XP_029284724.1 uncharacterized protein LOC115006582 [Cottoperca gobio]XP_029284733.1 uncharacterized protein LOC115006582 [Cottoperca gobio]XP_029284742.1 uncharacterized protein LOC115006582 [Cottoperca gobio]XP_029284750.1 unc
MDHQLLLETLEDLRSNDFKKFNWYLTINMLDGCKPIPTSRLESQDRTDTVTEMIKSYGGDMAVNVTVEILKKMMNNQDAENLKIRRAEGKAAAASSTSSAAAAPPAAAAASSMSSAAAAPPAAAAASSMSSAAAAPPAAAATMSAQHGSVIIAPTVGGTFQNLNITISK